MFKPGKNFVIILITATLLMTGAYFGGQYLSDRNKQSSGTVDQKPGETFDKTLYSIDEAGSVWWIVNKNRPLPKGYVPAALIDPKIKLRWASDAEAMQVSKVIAPSLEAMYKAAKKAGLNLELISGYRSEAYQKEVYTGQVRMLGEEEANKISAKPGTSEHQTGMAVDLGRPDKKCELEACFGSTAEGKWLAANAHKYGFILRYLKGQEASTGYQYEPWHIRFVGPELAMELYARKMTMEQFFGL